MDNEKSGAKQMPIGLIMSLAQHNVAMENFSRMDDLKQKALVQYISDSSTGEEAKSRIKNAVQDLEENNTSFLS